MERDPLSRFWSPSLHPTLVLVVIFEPSFYHVLPQTNSHFHTVESCLGWLPVGIWKSWISIQYFFKLSEKCSRKVHLSWNPLPPTDILFHRNCSANYAPRFRKTESQDNVLTSRGNHWKLPLLKMLKMHLFLAVKICDNWWSFFCVFSIFEKRLKKSLPVP